MGSTTKYDQIRRRRSGRLFQAANSLLPLPTLRALRYELRMTILRLTKSGVDKRFIGSRGLLVNVGCGARGEEGWVNIDSYAAPSVTCVRDCRTSLPLEAGSARGVFTEHFVEHLDYYEEAPLFFAECLRILEPGGTLRVIVPDGGKYLHAYCAPGWDELSSFSPLTSWDPASDDRPFSTLREVLPFRTKMEIVNYHFRQAGEHRFSYDYETLKDLLVSCGFEAISERSYRDSALSELTIDREFRAPESLVVEATAPGATASTERRESKTTPV